MQDRSPEHQEADPTTDPQRRLVDWANGRAGWLRCIVRHVVTLRRALDDQQLTEVFERFLSEQGLGEGRPVAEPRVDLPAGRSIEHHVLRITSLGEVTGVNALTPGATIDFSPGLTILYGENGVGKTGYARVLKRLATARNPEEIIPDINQDCPVDPSATIEYEVGGSSGTFSWRGEAGISPFTQIAVFDSPTVDLRLDHDLGYMLTPTEISLFAHVSAGIRDVQDRCAAYFREIAPPSNPFLRYFEQGTSVQPEIVALGPTTDIAALRALVVLPQDHQEEKAALEQQIAALQADTVQAVLVTHRMAADAWASIESAAMAASAFNEDRYNEHVTALQALRNSYKRIREETFGPGELPGPADDRWQHFVTTVESYKAHLASGGHGDDERCPYCRQALDSGARVLVQRYAQFLDDALARQVAEQEQFVQAEGRALLDRRIDEPVSALARLTEGQTQLNLLADARLLMDAMTAARSAIPHGAHLAADIPRLALRVKDTAAGRVASHEATIKVLTDQLKDRMKAVSEAKGKLAHLKAMIELDRHLPDITEYVERSGRARRLQVVVHDLPTIQRSLTELAKAASKEFLDHDFETRFIEEAAALGAPAVKLEFFGRQGTQLRRTSLDCPHRVTDILCEGEQRMLALADFLAEARMGGSTAPILLDDPVTSLDSGRQRQVAARIADLARERQVILFTHDIWLVTLLLGRLDRQPPEVCIFYEVSKDERATGRVVPGPGPRRDTMKVLKTKTDLLLNRARGEAGDARASSIEQAYGLMRSWCEVAVEEVLFADVIRRFRRNVMMGCLRNVHPDRLQPAIDTINDLFNSACEFIADHSQPLSTLGARPQLEDAVHKWEDSQQAISLYRKT